jgi:hypothetical protein
MDRGKWFTAGGGVVLGGLALLFAMVAIAGLSFSGGSGAIGIKGIIVPGGAWILFGGAALALVGVLLVSLQVRWANRFAVLVAATFGSGFLVFAVLPWAITPEPDGEILALALPILCFVATALFLLGDSASRRDILERTGSR